MPASESRMPASSSTIRMLCMFREDRCRHRLRYDRKLYDKACSHRMVFFHPNRSMVIFYNAAHNGKSQPGAAFLRGEVWQEEFLFHLAGYALAGVGDDDLNRVAARHQSGGDGNLTYDGILRRLGGVVDQVSHSAFDGVVVGQYLGKIGSQRLMQGDSVETSVEHR